MSLKQAGAKTVVRNWGLKRDRALGAASAVLKQTGNGTGNYHDKSGRRISGVSHTLDGSTPFGLQEAVYEMQ
eukprot:6212339-Pleurochrysis_carterae.AAC.3